MTAIDVDIEPPGLDGDEDGDPYTGVFVSIVELDGTRRSGYGGVLGAGTDDQVAALLVEGLDAVAAHRGPGLTDAVNRLLAQRGRGDR